MVVYQSYEECLEAQQAEVLDMLQESARLARQEVLDMDAKFSACRSPKRAVVLAKYRERSDEVAINSQFAAEQVAFPSGMSSASKKACLEYRLHQLRLLVEPLIQIAKQHLNSVGECLWDNSCDGVARTLPQIRKFDLAIFWINDILKNADRVNKLRIEEEEEMRRNAA